MTQLERLQATGIKRLGTAKSGFRFRDSSGEALVRADLERIKGLKIPPAWTNVAINRAAKGMLQAIGTDAAGRWQYLYHQSHVLRREQQKYERLVHFTIALPAMRKRVARDLNAPGLGRERVMACILRVLSTCFLRPGSQIYASENGSYGIATLRPRHVRVSGDIVEFKFPGKRQIPQQRELKDRQVAKVIRELLKHPAPEVFKYQNDAGQFVDVKRRQINQHIKEVMGQRFTAKDFRTWAGTLICASALARAGDNSGESKAARKRTMVQAIKETARVLGNTPAVCRSAYINPQVLSCFESGEVIDRCFEPVERLIHHRSAKLHEAEKALLRLLRKGKH